jgi:RNA polymerase sigma-70 factor (ECF subfamily)
MGKNLNLDVLISELSKNNDSALEELFNYYYPRLYNFSKAFLKIENGIDDILQEVFVKIWENRKNIKSKETFNAFIYTITRNLLLNELRSRLNNQKLMTEIQKNAVAEEFASVQLIEYKEMSTKITEVINQLPDRQKEVFKLSREDGLSHKEIAEKLGITTKTVEYHIAQSKDILRAKLQNLGLMSLLWFYLFL